MTNKHHIEELRDMLSYFKSDAESLYRKGQPGVSINLFRKLTGVDQKKLLCLALIIGDNDIENVAKYLMQKFDLTSRSIEELLAQMPAEDKAEIEEIHIQALRTKLPNGPSALSRLPRIQQKRIVQEICKACREIGALYYEEAFWILVPKDLADDALWIKASEGQDELRSPISVRYDPKSDEKYNLISKMRRALWILHVHNHPVLLDEISQCEASADDCGFALEWKSAIPELSYKMKFFVVQQDNFVEYSLNSATR